MTKKYGVKNTSECVFKFKIGKATIECRFTGGNLQSREPIPASYSTSNPIVQHVIESCDKFKNRHIFIIAEYGDKGQPVVAEPASAPAKKNPLKEWAKNEETKKKTSKKPARKEEKVMEEVKTHGEAVDALMAAGEFSMADLETVESCVAKAAEIGISFPNLNA